MTDKKANILSTALELFANEGFAATSTSSLAKKAGVSEALIFRHFKNKKGLLDAIFEQGEKKFMEFMGPILLQNSPKEVIKKTLQLPFSIDESEYDFWRLQMKLKWDSAYYNPNKAAALTDKLIEAFKQLGATHPEFEAKALNQLVESISLSLIRGELKDKQLYLDFLLAKYGL